MKNDWAKWLRCDVLKCLVGFNGWKECCCLFMYQTLSVKDCRSPEQMYLTNIFYKLLSQCLKEIIFAHLLYPSNCSATCKTPSLNDEGREKNPALMLVHQLMLTLRNIWGDLRHCGRGILKGACFLCSGRCSGCLFPACCWLLLPWVILGKFLPLVWLLYLSAALPRSWPCTEQHGAASAAALPKKNREENKISAFCV